MRVLITDHHLPGESLPAADAIVNPNLPGNDFPSKHLAGVGVAFYVMLGLRARLRESGWFAQRQVAEPNLAQLLDLVALGTVADVVPLDRNNRILVQQGILRIRAGQCVPGLRALLEVAGRDLLHRRRDGPGVCRRAASERGRATRRHVAGHRVSVDGRRGPRACHGCRTRCHEP